MRRRQHHHHRRLPAQRRQFLFEGLETRLVMDGVADNDPGSDATEVVLDCEAFVTTRELRVIDRNSAAGGSNAFPEPDGVLKCEDSEQSPDVLPTLQHFSTREELQEHLILQAVEQWRDHFGEPVGYDYPQVWTGDDWLRTFDQAGQTLRSEVGVTSALQVNYSGTNVQVAGVDEGDLVKTDGHFLYVAREDRLMILDVQDPTHLQVVSRITLDEPASELYVEGNRLTVISSHGSVRPLGRAMGPFGVLIDYWQPNVQVDVYDITDRAAPNEVASFEIDGSLVQSRAMGSHVVLVTQDETSLPPLEVHCNDYEESATEDQTEDQQLANRILPEDQWWPGRTCVYETKEEYLARISDGLLDHILPHYATGDRPGDFLTAPESIAATGTLFSQLISTTLIDVGAETPHVSDSAGVLTSYAAQVYANTEHVYFAASDWSENGEKTRIVEFSLGDDQDSVDVTAIGQVSGRLLNQFAMDEHEGYLRVATSEGWGGDATNSVFVLQENEEQLAVVGSITEITPGETIVAARFLGDQAFLVTFERIDPLVALDLSDPMNPVVVGELEIPGFSNYLHPLGSDYLIGLGRDADIETGWATDAQISLFNVQDLSLPSLVDREIIGVGSNAWSQAFFDHHAISFFEDVGILAVPFHFPYWFVETVLLGEGEEPTRVRPQSGLWVFHVDPSAGNPIEKLGIISHELSVERSFRIGDVLFTVSHDTVMAHNLTHPDRPVGSVYVGRHAFNDFMTVDVDDDSTKLDVLSNDRLPEGAAIVAVSDPIGGGRITISEDGRSIIYTAGTQLRPAPDGSAASRILPPAYGEYDSFKYTVQLADGMTERASVDVRLGRERLGRKMAELAQQDLARRLEISPDRIRISGAEPRVWSDSCLGDPNLDQVCAQVITPGFVVWLSVRESHFTYHTDTGTTVNLVSSSTPMDPGVIPDYFHVRQDSSASELDVLANDFPNTQFIKAPQIIAVSATDQGGTVTIQEGGFTLSYTPAASFRGTETFTYTVDNGATALVTVLVLGSEEPDDPAPADARVGIRLEVTDADGNPVTQVELGDQFFVNVYVNDLRDNAQGVFSAYIDLAFNVQVAKLGEIEFTSDYGSGISGAGDSSGINELGAFAGSIKPLGASERLLARVQLEAIHVGDLAVVSDPADLVPQHDFGLYGQNERVPWRQIDFTSVDIQIVNSFHNDLQPTDSNGDGNTSPTDALQIINWINEHGPGSIKTLRAAGLAAMAAGESYSLESRRFDINGDGHCTHMDVLFIFNRLNEDAEQFAAEQEAASASGPLSLNPGGDQSNWATNQIEPLAWRNTTDVRSMAGQLVASEAQSVTDRSAEVESRMEEIEALLDDLVGPRPATELLDAWFHRFGL